MDHFPRCAGEALGFLGARKVHKMVKRGYLLDSSSEPETRDNGSRAGAAGTASRRAAPRTSLAHSCRSQTPRGALWTGVPSTDNLSEVNSPLVKFASGRATGCEKT